ncbi:MAG: ParB/RepB/Spo0J family partition protein, partial [Litorimonas sp.]
MTATPNLTTQIPLDRIEMSQNNIRKGDTEPDPELMASLLADGQLQNIGVTPHASKPDTYVAVYGFRRLRAFRALAKAKDIAADAPVLCMVVDADVSEQTARALAENICRKAMNPVDEYEAFAKLAKQGLEPDAIAARQGVTVRKVRDRLALGQAAPCVRVALRKGEISLDIATAYASCPDLRRQERVFKELGRADPSWIRRTLRSIGISSDDTLGRLIDVDAYEQAGGRLERDLIDTHVTFLDEDIVFALRDALLQDRVAQLSADGWKWVEAYASRADIPYAGLGRAYPEPADLTDAEAATLDALEA